MRKLGKEGQEIYDSFIDYLQNTNRLETADTYIIYELATYHQIWIDNKKKVDSIGSVQEYDSGASNVNGYFVAMNKCSQLMEKIYHKLGIYEIMKSKLLQYGKMSSEVMSRIK